MKKTINAFMITKNCNKELKENKNSELKNGSYNIKKDSISFLTKKGEALVIVINPKTIDTVATLNDNVIQIKENNIAEVKNKFYSFI